MPIFFIEANIGAGKSTLLEYLKQKTTYVIVQEPVDQWTSLTNEHGSSILKKYYENPEKYALAFQMFVLSTRMKSILDALANNPDKVIICERSFFSDLIFVTHLKRGGNFDKITTNVYLSMYNLVTELANVKIHGRIYLRTTPDICMERIKKRARVGENAIDPSAIENLHSLHDEALLNTKDVLILSGNANFETNAERHLANINEFIWKQV